MERPVLKIEIAKEIDQLVASLLCPKCGIRGVAIDTTLFPEITPQILAGRLIAVHGKHIFLNNPYNTSETK